MPEDVDLRRFLASRDVPCPSCGYNLRGLAGEVCPECRQELVLTVRLAEPRLGWWLAGLIGLACGVGFDALLTVYFITMTILRQFMPPAGEFVTAVLAPLAVLAPSLWMWLTQRARIRRQPKRRQVLLALGCWGLMAGSFALFAALVR